MHRQWSRLVRDRNLIVLMLVALAGLLVTPAMASEKPVRYLTFDDGPSSDRVTELVLATLANYGAKATFFITGERARAEPEMIGAIVRDGHAVGNHSYTHLPFVILNEDEIQHELEVTNQLVMNAGGPRMICYRPPFGKTDERVAVVAKGAGFTEILWDIDTNDWRPAQSGSNLMDALDTSFDGSVILMHDGPVGRYKTYESLSIWLANEWQNYDFRVLPQCSVSGYTYAGAESSSDSMIKVAAAKNSSGDPESQNIEKLLIKLVMRKAELQASVGRAVKSGTVDFSDPIDMQKTNESPALESVGQRMNELRRLISKLRDYPVIELLPD